MKTNFNTFNANLRKFLNNTIFFQIGFNTKNGSVLMP
jgi:hypothetical protein